MNQSRDIVIKKTHNQYWTYQLLGWSLASLYWAYIFYFKQDFTVFQTLTNFLFDVIVGISLTHIYILIVKNPRRNSIDKGTVIHISIAIVVLAFLFMILVNLKWYFYATTFKGESIDFLSALFFWEPPLITGLRLMAIWVLAYHLYHYYEHQSALTEHNAELSILAKQIQLDHLSNQLNPHFLFNSLNSVKSLISENPSKAKRSIDLLSDLLRSSIYSKEPMTTLEEELQLVYDYIELEKLRFEERLQLNVNIDKEVLGFKIPFLCIQTLVENALKHGIQNSIKGGIITLSVTKKKDNIEIALRNPGQIVDEQRISKTSVGLNNLKQRLYLHYKEKGDFTLREAPKGYVTGTITIPLQ